MSVESMALVLHHSRARGTTKLVLLGIANHDGDGGAWPAVTTLAKYANTDVRSVQRALRTLETMGEVITEVQGGGTRDHVDELRPNRYTVALRCPLDCDGSSQHKTRQSRLKYPVTPVSPGDASVTGGGDVAVTRGVTPVSPKPATNPTMNPAVGTSPQSEPAPVDNGHRCDRGWLDGEDEDGRRRPCLVCKPHLRAKASSW